MSIDLPEWAAKLDSALERKLGFELLEVSPGRVRGRMPVDGNTQVLGIWHGGASACLAETLGSCAALAELGEGGTAVGVDLNVTHHRPVGRGWVSGTATAAYVGATLASYEIELEDDQARRVASARLTLQIRRRSASGPVEPRTNHESRPQP